MLDKKKNLALFCTKSAGTVISEFWGCPLVTILSWWAVQHGLQFAHAGAVGTEDGGILLVGTGGSGKSATSLSCLLDGFSYLADDYCFLSHSETTTQVCSVYCTGKLEKSFLQHYSQLDPIAHFGEHPESKKSVLQLMPSYQAQLIRSISLQAVLIPVVTDSEKTDLIPTGLTQVLLQLAPNVLCQIPGTGSRELGNLKTYLEDLPAYHLRLGLDWNAPSVIRELIGELV